MTDKEYLFKMHHILIELKSLDPTNMEDKFLWSHYMDNIRSLNLEWHHNRRWRLWHFWIKLFVLFCMLALVVWYIVN